MAYKRKRSGYANSAKKRRVMRKRTYKSRVTRALPRVVRSLVLKNTETKYNVNGYDNYQLYHNSGTQVAGVNYLTYFSNLLSTSVGTSQNTRIGDSVFGRFLSIKLWLSNKSDRPNVMYRIAVVSVPPDQLVGNPAGLFKGEAGNKIIDSINTDRYKIIYHKIVKSQANDYSLESGATLKEKSIYHKITIPLKNRMIKYSLDSGVTPSYQNNCLSLMVLAYDATGTLTTDNIASYSMLYKFYFKDP